MNIIGDTGPLVMTALCGDEAQARGAETTLERAGSVIVTRSRSLRVRLDASKTRADRPIVEAGITALEAGVDFADGSIEFEGRRRGGAGCATFDQRPVRALRSRGLNTMPPRAKAKP